MHVEVGDPCGRRGSIIDAFGDNPAFANTGVDHMLTRFSIDDSLHNRDGLLVQAWDGDHKVDAFISRRVMDEWVEPVTLSDKRRTLFRKEYNELGQQNLTAIGRIVAAKYERGAAFNRQHPFVDVLTSDIIESGETLDKSKLVREPLPPAFERIPPRRPD